MLNFLLFDDAKLHRFHRPSKKKHFARLAKQDSLISIFSYCSPHALFVKSAFGDDALDDSYVSLI